MEIIEITEYSDEILSALNVLMPQLSPSAEPLDELALKNIINHPATHLLMAVENDAYFGTLSLVTFTISTGIKGWIDDVVVAEEARGKGVGELLSKHAIILARSLGAKTVDLTSRPSRVAANELYKKVGFNLRETNVYRYSYT
ncbi:GNAT family N-acetyltransferase [Vreelandella titanicae]|uniref:GNAT family N-acetyltransferase n=1 Tax=Vreelandella titanicae TaxID=664683 RepID=UPI001F1B7CB4|nr:GNAT family N-acetyltransferase [Halomonas titanicae]MBR9902392.1 GNAT family N-acetyltransferase [Gammaproteobacteria bacterium]MCE7519037.1 GNAT family N-acetyltransferase [Halomonas titanicae]